MKKTLSSLAFAAGTVVVGTGTAGAQEVPPPSAPPPAPPTPQAAGAEVLPPAPPPPPAAPAPHTVAPGDTLSGISHARLGTSERWTEIYAVNQNVLDDPDLVEVGQVLQIPAGSVPVPADLLATVSGATAPSRSAAPARRSTPVRRAVRSSSSSGGGLANIRRCESGGNYRAVSSSGKYRGAYQFDQRTWESVGGSGDPAAAPPAEQDARAAKLRGQRGSNPWPNCG